MALVRRKPRLLLAALLLRHGGTVPTDELIEVLWGDTPPASARANLHSYVSTLRRLLQNRSSPLVATGRHGYGLRIEPGDFDLATFEQRGADARKKAHADRAQQAARSFSAALDLWRGDVLASLELTGPLRAQVTQLEEMRLDVEEEWMDARLSADDHVASVPEFRGLVRAQPFRERRWGRLMLALKRSGRTKEALETYQALRSLLDEELGVGPSSEIDAIHRAVLTNDVCMQTRSRASSDRVVGDLLRRAERPHVTLVGRDRERAELAELAEHERLVTVTGPGGCGKSALVLDTAHAVADRFFKCVVVTDPERAALSRCGSALDFTRSDGFRDTFSAGPGRRSLVVLDNTDRWDSTAAEAVRRLLAQPDVTVLATSRSPLRISGEVVWPLDPLPTPVTDEQTAATRLFLERAAPLMPGHRVGHADHALAARISRSLDGLPLALEMAATRLRILPMNALADRLNISLDCLLEPAVSGPASERLPLRDVNTTLTSVFDWSYARLTEAEQLLLQRLAALPGPFGLADVEDAAGDAARPPLSPGWVLPLLASLVEQSMVQCRTTRRGRSFRVLGPIRAFVARTEPVRTEPYEAV
ncbi:BTAD domain-containing putative transcriptional regulator [Streptomyces aureus]|uniref:AfsR/SARP family transcriptional regulator n=1 Tax=Streptomyces aureus TaxID=193461 RepID=UPI0036807D76